MLEQRAKSVYHKFGRAIAQYDPEGRGVVSQHDFIECIKKQEWAYWGADEQEEIIRRQEASRFAAPSMSFQGHAAALGANAVDRGYMSPYQHVVSDQVRLSCFREAVDNVCASRCTIIHPPRGITISLNSTFVCPT